MQSSSVLLPSLRVVNSDKGVHLMQPVCSDSGWYDPIEQRIQRFVSTSKKDPGKHRAIIGLMKSNEMDNTNEIGRSKQRHKCIIAYT